MSRQRTETFVALIYGPSGLGKTTDCGFSFPNAYFLAAPGALKSIESNCGFVPASSYIRTLPDAIKVMEVLGKEKKYDTIVIDDFSFMAEQTLNWLESTKKMSGFKLWGELKDIVLDLRDKSRFCGMNVVMNAWEQAPKVTPEGSRLRGGPLLPGKLPESVPALCDVVLRATPEPKRKPHPVVYRCNPDMSWSMKDRNSIANRVDPCPMNLREILIAGGEQVGTHRFPEHDNLVEKFSKLFTGKQDEDKDKANQTYQILKKEMTVIQARWTIRDALDRALIRAETTRFDDDFFKETNELI